MYFYSFCNCEQACRIFCFSVICITSRVLFCKNSQYAHKEVIYLWPYLSDLKHTSAHFSIQYNAPYPTSKLFTNALNTLCLWTYCLPLYLQFLQWFLFFTDPYDFSWQKLLVDNAIEKKKTINAFFFHASFNLFLSLTMYLALSVAISDHHTNLKY